MSFESHIVNDPVTIEELEQIAYDPDYQGDYDVLEVHEVSGVTLLTDPPTDVNSVDVKYYNKLTNATYVSKVWIQDGQWDHIHMTMEIAEW